VADDEPWTSLAALLALAGAAVVIGWQAGLVGESARPTAGSIAL
jgi:hypothetical protein